MGDFLVLVVSVGFEGLFDDPEVPVSVMKPCIWVIIEYITYRHELGVSTLERYVLGGLQTRRHPLVL